MDMDMDTANLDIQAPRTGCSAEVEHVLRALPEWFGVEAATLGYIESAKTKKTILATVDDAPVGFLMIERHFPESAEVYCIGVLREHHSSGIGRQMLQAAEAYLAADGVRILQVKTVAPERECPDYAKTRAFYAAVGFQQLEVFTKLWGPETPCLLLVKALSP